jgi:hypothetical protein
MLRRQSIHGLTDDVQGFPARRDYACVRTRAKHCINDTSDLIDNILTIIHDYEHRGVADVGYYAVDRRSPGLWFGVNCSADRRRY